MNNLKPQHHLIIRDIVQGIPIKQALIRSGYSDNPKSLDAQAKRLKDNVVFSGELRKAEEKYRDNLLLTLKLDRMQVLAEFYQLYQQVKDQNDNSSAIKCLENIAKLTGSNVSSEKVVKHDHNMTFENLLLKDEKEKQMISIN